MADVSAFYPSLAGDGMKNRLVTERGNADLLTRQMKAWSDRLRMALSDEIYKNTCMTQVWWDVHQRASEQQLHFRGADQTDAGEMAPLAAEVHKTLVQETKTYAQINPAQRPHIWVLEIARSGDAFTVRFRFYPRAN